MLGFWAKLCTLDAMLLLKNEIVDRQLPTLDNRAGLGLDVQGAFDSVRHSAIFRQVYHFHMGEKTFSYIKDILTNCTTRLVAGELQLPFKQSGSMGTSQRWVICSLLFNLVIIGVARRLERVRNIKYTIYADDITLWSTGGSDSQIEVALQEAVVTTEKHL
ncbi:uncharacterized protein LOC142765710 [Rhipicephalus microplus]|uniref:uncharacterized protein LOC142765710 n=1 Tax=Rhipicephalus microplus TaxID=6941 RepID=UPI003F6C5978